MSFENVFDAGAENLLRMTFLQLLSQANCITVLSLSGTTGRLCFVGNFSRSFDLCIHVRMTAYISCVSTYIKSADDINVFRVTKK
jgi:hypothetical protein